MNEEWLEKFIIFSEHRKESAQIIVHIEVFLAHRSRFGMNAQILMIIYLLC